jgi:hypothetical protein
MDERAENGLPARGSDVRPPPCRGVGGRSYPLRNIQSIRVTSKCVVDGLVTVGRRPALHCAGSAERAEAAALIVLNRPV